MKVALELKVLQAKWRCLTMELEAVETCIAAVQAAGIGENILDDDVVLTDDDEIVAEVVMEDDVSSPETNDVSASE